jgi:hypothetical protein
MSYLMVFKSMFLNTCFNRESSGNPWFPAKALGELFTDSKVTPEPEFKSFDLKSLCPGDPDMDQCEPSTMADADAKRRRSAQW